MLPPEPEWYWKLIASPVMAATVVGLFGIISIWVGLGRFRSERWWERKAAAYAAAIEGLHGIYDYSDAMRDAELKSYDFADELKEKLLEGSRLGWFEIRKAASLGSFVVSKPAAAILQEVSRELDELSDDVPPAEFHERRKEITGAAIIRLTGEARRDLGT